VLAILAACSLHALCSVIFRFFLRLKKTLAPQLPLFLFKNLGSAVQDGGVAAGIPFLAVQRFAERILQFSSFTIHTDVMGKPETHFPNRFLVSFFLFFRSPLIVAEYLNSNNSMKRSPS
jgi:hypothetical protein